MEALRSHGYRKEALRLAVAIVRTMKRQQRDWQYRWQSYQNKGSTSACTSSGTSSNPLHNNVEGWIGNPLDPIGSLFDTLAEACLTPDSKPLDAFYGSLVEAAQSTNNGEPNGNNNNGPTVGPANPSGAIINNSLLIDASIGSSSSSSLPREKPKYHHVNAYGTRDKSEGFLCLAVEAALVGLGQQRLMPPGAYAQHKASQQEEILIRKLADIELDPVLVTVLRKQAMMLLEGGPFSGLGCGIHAESMPMHNFAKFLFNALLMYDPDMSYNVGLRAMRYVSFNTVIQSILNLYAL